MTLVWSVVASRRLSIDSPLAIRVVSPAISEPTRHAYIPLPRVSTAESAIVSAVAPATSSNSSTPESSSSFLTLQYTSRVPSWIAVVPRLDRDANSIHSPMLYTKRLSSCCLAHTLSPRSPFSWRASDPARQTGQLGHGLHVRWLRGYTKVPLTGPPTSAVQQPV
jgi:hypothetical protein